MPAVKTAFPAQFASPGLFFDLHGNGRVWELDTVGREIDLHDLAFDLLRNKKVQAGKLVIAEAMGLEVGRRISSIELTRRFPKEI